MTTALACRVEPDPAIQTDPGGTWYVIHTRPMLVKDLVAAARDLGVDVYAPVMKYEANVGPKNRRKREVVTKPVFPGYAFVRRHEHQELRNLPLYLRHHFQYVRAGGRFCEVWPKVIEEMRAQEVEWCRIGPKPTARDLFAIGQWVKIQGDLFPPARVLWVGDAKVKIDSELGPIEVDAAAVTVVEG